ncbi:MAG: nucleoside hydrolase [Muribaculaceae bacterium]|nr:nucleoside hydrolase [Muribaculaceae bacterium]
MRIFRNLLIAALLPLLACCGKKTQATGESPEWVIVETDIASSFDDIIALDLLHRANRQGLYELKAVMVNREGTENARIADIMNCYYKHPEIPIGTVRDGVENPPLFIDYWKMGYPDRFADEPRMATSLTDAQLEQLPDAETLYRQLLVQAPDSSVNIVSIGFTTNLARLLYSQPDQYSPLSGTDLVRQKVKALYIQAGDFGDDPEADFNFRQDPENARTVMSLWPSAIYFSPMNAGQPYHYLPQDVLADLEAAGMKDSPVYHAYAHHPESEGQCMWDAMCTLQLLRPELFRFQGPFDAYLDSALVLRFRSNPAGRHYVQEAPATDAERDSVLTVLRTLLRRK